MRWARRGDLSSRRAHERLGPIPVGENFGTRMGGQLWSDSWKVIPAKLLIDASEHGPRITTAKTITWAICGLHDTSGPSPDRSADLRILHPHLRCAVDRDGVRRPGSGRPRAGDRHRAQAQREPAEHPGGGDRRHHREARQLWPTQHRGDRRLDPRSSISFAAVPGRARRSTCAADLRLYRHRAVGRGEPRRCLLRPGPEHQRRLLRHEAGRDLRGPRAPRVCLSQGEVQV